MQPLAGITVVSLEQAVAAPFATRQLADLGARVIKVERPGDGDFARGYDGRVNGLSSYFAWCNRSKESMALDLKSARGRDILDRLVGRADVLVQNLTPGATARMGLDYDTLSSRFPSLIVCDISGYGGSGPDCDRKAYDLLIQAEAGFLSVTGTPDEMVKAAISLADIAAAMYAYSTILAALIERNRTGKGTHIDISMLEAMAEWMSFPLYYTYGGAAPPGRTAASHATIYPYGPFATADGSVLFGIQNEREWDAFCNSVLGQAPLAREKRFAGNAERSANRVELRGIIEGAFAHQLSATIVERLNEAGVANAVVNGMAELWTHRQLAARGRWTEVNSPAGPIPAMLPPGLAAARMGAIPAVGEHTRQILAELGYDDGEAGRHAS